MPARPIVMKDLLVWLGLPSAIAAALVTYWNLLPGWAQAFLPWTALLLVALILRGYTWGGWHFEKIPKLKVWIADLEKGVLSPIQWLRIESALHTHDPRHPVRRAMLTTDRVLASLWHTERWTLSSFVRAWEIAILYPIALLMVLWIITGIGTLGDAVLLPPVSWEKRILLLVLVGVLPFVYLIMEREASRRGRWTTFLLAVSFGAIGVAIGLAFVVTGAGAVAVAVAGLIAGSCFVVGTSHGAGTNPAFVVGAIVGAVALAGADPDPVGVASVVTRAAVVAGAGAGAIAVAFAVAFGAERIEALVRQRAPAMAWTVAVGFALVWLLLLGLVSKYLPTQVDKPSRLLADESAFVMIAFLGLLPIFNALLDWISVGLTRAFIRRYLAGSLGVWLFVLFDLFSALALMIALYLGVLVVFKSMSTWGWGVDAKAMIIAFRDDPLAPQAQWLTAMAITNLFPTMIHLGLALTGIATGFFHGHREALTSAIAKLRSASPIVMADGKPARQVSGLSGFEARILVDYLFVDRWLGVLIALGLVFALVPLFAALLSWALGFLV